AKHAARACPLGSAGTRAAGSRLLGGLGAARSLPRLHLLDGHPDSPPLGPSGTKFASGPMAPMYEPWPSVINSFRWLGKIDMTTSGSPADRTRHERTFPAAVESRAGRGRSGPETSGSPGPWD